MERKILRFTRKNQRFISRSFQGKTLQAVILSHTNRLSCSKMDKQPPKGGTKAARQQQRELARLKFFYQHWTFKEISGWLGVSENTIGKWAKDDGWKDEKRSLTQSREQALLAAYKQLGEIDSNIAGRPEGERFATKDERLARRDLRRDIMEMEAGSGVRDVINVSQALLNWLRAFDPTKAIEVSALFDQYIKEMLR